MKHIEDVLLKDKLFKTYKINKSEVYIFKKLHTEILKNTPNIFDTPYRYNDMIDEIKNNILHLFLLYYKNKPIAYSLVIFYNKTNIYDLKQQISKKIDYDKCVEFGGAGVLEKHRGYGIHNYFIKFREDFCKKKEKNIFFVSAHPKNTYSINNIKKNKYKLIKRFINYENHEKLLFEKKI